jgi:hypothetical protein
VGDAAPQVAVQEPPVCGTHAVPPGYMHWTQVAAYASGMNEPKSNTGRFCVNPGQEAQHTDGDLGAGGVPGTHTLPVHVSVRLVHESPFWIMQSSSVMQQKPEEPPDELPAPEELRPTPEEPEDEATPLLEPPDEDDAPLDELARPSPPEELESGQPSKELVSIE